MMDLNLAIHEAGHVFAAALQSGGEGMISVHQRGLRGAEMNCFVLNAGGQPEPLVTPQILLAGACFSLAADQRIDMGAVMKLMFAHQALDIVGEGMEVAEDDQRHYEAVPLSKTQHYRFSRFYTLAGLGIGLQLGRALSEIDSKTVICNAPLLYRKIEKGASPLWEMACLPVGDPESIEQMVNFVTSSPVPSLDGVFLAAERITPAELRQRETEAPVGHG